MKEQFQRTEMLIGKEALEKLFKAHVAVFGVGGVGGYVVEALARAGVGALTLVDHDVISESNLNRQILATHDTIEKRKVEVAKERILSINPDCKVTAMSVFVLPREAKANEEKKEDGQVIVALNSFDFTQFDYVVDAIDTVAGKLAIIEKAKQEDVPVISSMGTGNKMDPSAFRVADIFETSVCPLAKVMRKECKKRGIKSLKVVYSTEEPIKVNQRTPGSTSFTPAAAGLVIASEVVKDLIA